MQSKDITLKRSFMRYGRLLSKLYPKAHIEEILYDTYLVKYPLLWVTVHEDYVISYLYNGLWTSCAEPVSKRHEEVRDYIYSLYPIDNIYTTRNEMLVHLYKALEDYGIKKNTV